MPAYIQRRTYLQAKTFIETVDEAPTYKEATVLCNKYKRNDAFSYYYVSRRPCNSWIALGIITFPENLAVTGSNKT